MRAKEIAFVALDLAEFCSTKEHFADLERVWFVGLQN